MGSFINISHSVVVDENELSFEFIRAPGPGGQNVNKVSTAVQLRFDIQNSQTLSDPIKERITKLAGSRMTNEGVLVITAKRYRTQSRNRQDALDRLIALITKAMFVPKRRKKTKPNQQAKEQRLFEKKQQALKKKTRKKVDREQD